MRGGPWLAVLLVLFQACGGSRSIPAGRETVVIGFLGAFSGDGAAFTGLMLRGAEIAVDEYNRSQESRFEARIEQADTKGSAEGAAEAAAQISANQAVAGVVGPFSSAEALAAGPVLVKSGIPFLLPAVSDIALAQAGFPRQRRLLADDLQEGIALTGELLRRMKGAARTIVVHDGSGSGVAFSTGAKTKLEGAGGNAVVVEALGQVDWAAFAAEILKEPPAAVIHGGAGDRSGALVAALRGAGYQGLFAASRHALDISFANAAGESAEGSLSDSTCAHPQDPALESFREAYASAFSGTPPICSLESYDATFMLLDAVEEVAPEPEEVARFLQHARSFLGDGRLYEIAEDGSLVTGNIWVHEFRRNEWRFMRRATT